MSLAPQEHLPGYRTSAGRAIFAIPGSSVNVVSGVTVSNRGTYTSVPAISSSGGSGSGFVGTASMGIKSVSITPVSLPASTSDNLPILITSSTGQGAAVSASRGAPDLAFYGQFCSGHLYFNPSVGCQISVSPGSGGVFTPSYRVPENGISVVSQGGLYSSQPSLSLSGGYSGQLRYGFGGITSSQGICKIEGTNSTEALPVVLVWDGIEGNGFVANAAYQPHRFDVSEVASPAWNCSLPKPVIALTGCQGSGATITPRYGLLNNSSAITLSSQGTGYGTGQTKEYRVLFKESGVTIVEGTIFDNGNGGLDINSLNIPTGTLHQYHPGWFSGVPSVEIADAGYGVGNGNAVFSVNLMQMIAIECSGGTGFTQADIAGLAKIPGAPSRGIQETTSSLDRPVGHIALAYANVSVSSSSISDEGNNYPWGAYLYWTGGGGFYSFGTSTEDGGKYPVLASTPSIASSKRVKSLVITGGPAVTTAPTVTISAPAAGSTPAFSVTLGEIDSITTTNRGTTGSYDWGSNSTIQTTGIYEDSGLSYPAQYYTLYVNRNYLAGASVTSRGSGYLGGEVVFLGNQQVGSVQNLEISSIAIVAGGSGYVSAPTISIGGSGGGSATASIAPIGSSGSALNLLSLADINLTTGDARKIAYALAERFYLIFSGNAFFRVRAERTTGTTQPNLDRKITYKFTFGVKKSGDYALKNE